MGLTDGQLRHLSRGLAAKVQEYFMDEQHRQEFEKWHLETYGQPYVWKKVYGGGAT